MSNARRPERDELRQLSTAGPGGLVAQAAAGSDQTPFDHAFAVIRERARDWRARSERSRGGILVAGVEPCDGMGI